MCFDLDSRPPIAAIAGGALDHESLTLAAADGTSFRAFRARAAQPSGAGMLVLPDVRGLHPYYEELALRFAEAGVDAVAIDYFGRTAGTAERADDFDHQPHIGQVAWASLQQDIRAGVEALRADGRVRSAFTVGFCFGGRTSYDSATLGLGLAGVVGFYGWPVGESRGGVPAPIDELGRFECPVLAIFGGADQGIPTAAAQSFDAALRAAGVEHETWIAPDAPHSFFDRKAAEFQAQSDEAWRRVRDFIERHARQRPAGR
ncbi:MAG TPA: dienelactone hydrolase family protein [Candidatus Limnocylindrales bacterium]